MPISMKISSMNAVNLMTEKLVSLGVQMSDARITAEVLIEAELRGDPSHGIVCLVNLANAIKKGGILTNKNPAIVVDNKAIAVIDAENLLGPVAGNYAVTEAVKKAKEYGISAVSVRKSHHLFTLGYYSKLIAQNGMIGILTTSTAPAMFAPGGLEKVLGTNPFSIGIPTNDKPIIVDMSSTQVARGKIKEAAKNNKNIPLDWAVNKEGHSTENPSEALEGALQPLGGYKGFALALAIDLLSNILSESASGKEIFGTSMHANPEDKKTAHKGDLFIAIDISKFTSLDTFTYRVTQLVESIKNSKKKEGVSIYIPGEKAHNKDKLIEIDDKLYEEIMNL